MSSFKYFADTENKKERHNHIRQGRKFLLLCHMWLSRIYKQAGRAKPSMLSCCHFFPGSSASTHTSHTYEGGTCTSTCRYISAFCQGFTNSFH